MQLEMFNSTSYRDSAEPYLRFVVGVSYAKLRLVYEKRLVGDLLKSERLKCFSTVSPLFLHCFSIVSELWFY